MQSWKRIFSRIRKRKYPFKFVYSDAYWMVDLGNHIFPAEKYRLVYEKLLVKGAKREHFHEPDFAGEEDILLVHTPKYLKKLKSGKLSQAEIMTMELPYSPELLSFAQLMVGGTVKASRIAMEDGLAVHIGGGFHHAFQDHGEGFCVLNDVAVAMRRMQNENKIQRGMVVDCDVHQGNGTAKVFSEDENVFTFSIHQMDIYPAQKEESSLDIGLWSGDGDQKYLSVLQSHIPDLYKKFKPNLIYYLAGADPYEKDQLGSLKLTFEGLKDRDRIVIEGALQERIPIVLLFAGGYAYDVEDTVAIHLNTIGVAQKLRRKYR
jgi:acetoin utilization deacetylase AcuC-like enzyme